LHFLKRILRSLYFSPIALFLLFEEWGWERLAAWFAELGRLPIWRKLEDQIVRLPPWAALVAFGVPVLALIPFKLLALYLLAQGHVGLGIAFILAAKIAGTALAARLFQLTHPALMQMRWFARTYVPWKIWKDLKLRQVRASFPWRLGRRIRFQSRLLTLELLAALRSLISSWRK